MLLGRSRVTDAAKDAHRSRHTEDETVFAGLRALTMAQGEMRRKLVMSLLSEDSDKEN